MELTVSNKTILRILLLSTLFVALVLALFSVKAQLVWIAISFFLALALEPVVDRISKLMPWRSRGLAVVVVFVVLITVVSYVIISLTPPLISETGLLIKNTPDYANDFLNSHNIISDYIRTHDLVGQVSQYQSQIASKTIVFGSSALGIIGSILSSLVALISILTFTFFMVLEGPKIMSVFWQYQPENKRAHRQELAKKMHRTVNDYVSGNIFTSIIAAVTTAIMLKILGIPYTIALGILVGIFDLIPLVGATIAAVVITLLVLVFAGINPALIMLTFFIVYQQVENNVIQPLVYSKSVKISPLVVGIAGLLGAVWAGLIGALVAIPVAASLQILVKDYLDNKKK
jgi:predicted PurR-regulated permease PerM